MRLCWVGHGQKKKIPFGQLPHEYSLQKKGHCPLRPFSAYDHSLPALECQLQKFLILLGNAMRNPPSWITTHVTQIVYYPVHPPLLDTIQKFSGGYLLRIWSYGDSSFHCLAIIGSFDFENCAIQVGQHHMCQSATQVTNTQHDCVVWSYTILLEYMFITKSCHPWES